MGSFFTNVQVRVHDGGRPALVEALREALTAKGMVEVADEEEADRTLIVTAVDPGGWVALYDTRTESQDSAALDELARVASVATGGFAFTTLVHDSDILALALFEAGVLRDRYDSYPDYFEPRSDEAKAALAGDVTQWAPLLADGVDESELAAAFARRDLFAERTLAEVERALGVERGRAGVGYRYLEGDARDDSRNVALHVRQRQRPDWEAGAEGPPALLAPPVTRLPLTVAEGDPLRTSISTLNQGGATRGIRVAVWGEAVERGLVELDSIELIVGDVRNGAPRTTHALAHAEDASGQKMRFVELPDAQLPAGVPQLPFPTDGDVAGFMDAQNRARVHVHVVGRVVRAGKGGLHMGLVCLEAPEVQVSLSHTVTVDAPLWAPLRVAEGHPLAPRSMALRPLSGERAHVALAVLRDGSRAEHGRRALQAFARALDACSFAGELDVAVFHADTERRPTTEHLTGLDVDALREQLATSAVMTVQARPPREALAMEALVQRAAEGGAGLPRRGGSGDRQPHHDPARRRASGLDHRRVVGSRFTAGRDRGASRAARAARGRRCAHASDMVSHGLGAEHGPDEHGVRAGVRRERPGR